MTEVCERCSGSGKVVGFVCPGFIERELKCFDCGGSGSMDDVRRMWAKDGQHLKRFRQSRNWSQMETAKWLGVSLVDWNQAEQGHVDPAPMYDRVQQKKLQEMRSR